MHDSLVTAPVSSPEAVPYDGVGRELLAQRCQNLEISALHHKHVTREELEAKRPGGAQNPDTSATGWLEYLCDLHRWHATAMSGALPQETVRFSEQDSLDLRDMMAENPAYVALSDGTRRGVFPKSEYAMDRIAYIDAALRGITVDRVALELAEPSPEALEALGQAIHAKEELQREFVWIAMHHSPDVPWEDDGLWEHDSPAWTRALTIEDFDQVRNAYIEVNYRRLNVVAAHMQAARGFSTDTATSRETFNGVMAAELGVSPRDIARKWSRGMLYGLAYTKFESNERAKERAERDR